MSLAKLVTVAFGDPCWDIHTDPARLETSLHSQNRARQVQLRSEQQYAWTQIFKSVPVLSTFKSNTWSWFSRLCGKSPLLAKRGKYPDLYFPPRGSFWAQPTEEGKKSPSIAHLREPHCQREIAGQHSTKMTFCSHLKTVSKDLWALDHSGSQQDGLGSSELGISMDCKVKWREITLNPFTPDMETLNIQMVASVIWPE